MILVIDDNAAATAALSLAIFSALSCVVAGWVP